MDFLDKLGGKRLLTELVHILREKDSLRAVDRMNELGLLRFINPELHMNAATRKVLEEAKKIVSWFELLFLERRSEKWAVYFLALCESLTDDQFWGTCTRLAVNEHYREKLFEMRKKAGEMLDIMQRKAARGARVERSDIYHWLKELPVELLLYMMAKTDSEEVKKFVSLYFTQLQNVRCFITGRDLQKLGVPPGPRFREILDMLLDARLNNLAQSREDELQLARQQIK
jgi:tRNA nucleotidyltransferase (CCA-adding enzyme)